MSVTMVVVKDATGTVDVTRVTSMASTGTSGEAVVIVLVRLILAGTVVQVQVMYGILALTCKTIGSILSVFTTVLVETKVL